MKRLIDFPFFSTSEHAEFETRIYDDASVRIEVKPGRCGLATIRDKNLLNYAFEVMKAEEGAFGSKVNLQPEDLFENCMFTKSAPSAHGLSDALERLRSTSIRTTVNSIGKRERRYFSWIQAANMQTRLEGERTVVEIIKVELIDWIWQPIFEDDDTFQASPGAFTINRGN